MQCYAHGYHYTQLSLEYVLHVLLYQETLTISTHPNKSYLSYHIRIRFARFVHLYHCLNILNEMELPSLSLLKLTLFPNYALIFMLKEKTNKR